MPAQRILPRILLIRQDYLVVPELERALARMRIPHAVVDFAQSLEFVQELAATAGSRAGRPRSQARVLAHHTYEHRLAEIVRRMREAF